MKFSIVSHDLCNPVGSLKASLTLLESKNQVPVLVNQFTREVDFLQHTLDNILYWSLSQQNAIWIMLRMLDLRDILEDVADSLTGLTRIKNITVSISPGSPQIKADEQLLIIVLRNILHNAIKLTPEFGQIEMMACSDRDSTQIQIRDSGPGIGKSPESEVIKGKQGTGLELNLSKELMQRNGGEFEIKSEPQEGTLVRLKWKKTEGDSARHCM